MTHSARALRLVALMVAAPWWPMLAQNRQFSPARWTEIGGVRGAVESSLLRPLLLTATPDLLVVFDYGDHALKAFRFDGSEAWRVGRSGGGPREFANPTDLQVDAGGRFWVLDPNNLRITLVDAAGSVNGMIRLPRPLTRVVPFHGGRFMGLDNSETFAFLLSASGDILDTLAQPPELRAAPALATEARVTPVGTGEAAIVSFLYGGALLKLTSEGARSAYVPGIEPIELPKIVQWERGGALFTRLDPAAPYGSMAVSSYGSDVFVLFAGRGPDAGRLVDIYGVEDLRYRRSVLLPEDGCHRLAVPTESTFACLVAEPMPAVRVWRLETSN